MLEFGNEDKLKVTLFEGRPDALSLLPSCLELFWEKSGLQGFGFTSESPFIPAQPVLQV